MTGANWRQNLDEWPIFFVGVPFEITKSALVIVDMQRYWADPYGPVGHILKRDYPASFEYFYDRLIQTVIPNLAKVLSRYRRLHLPIVHITTGTSRADGKDLPSHLQRRFASDNGLTDELNLLRVGSKWHEVVPELAPQEGELVLNKTSRSAFNSTGIDLLLRNLCIEHLVVGGLASNGCVDLTARDAADRGFEAFLLEDGCVTFTEDAHIPVFRTFQRIFGGILAAEEVLQT